MSVAKNYAQALYESVGSAADSKGKLDQLEKDLQQLVQAFAVSRDLRLAMEGSVISPQEKTGVFKALQEKNLISAAFQPFLGLLTRKGRLNQLSEIQDQFASIRLEKEGGVLGEVVSAETLSSEDLQGLQKTFSGKLGKQVVFKTQVDPGVLGGIKVLIQGVTYDGTLRTQLDKVRENCFQSISKMTN